MLYHKVNQMVTIGNIFESMELSDLFKDFQKYAGNINNQISRTDVLTNDNVKIIRVF